MDLEPVYDWTGSVVGWVVGDRVLDRGGGDAAVRHGDWVYDYAGRVLGTYTGGWFRNVAGDYAAFTPGATGGPPLPPLQPAPGPPSVAAPPPAPAFPPPPPPPAPSRAWSGSGWTGFLAGK